MQIQGVDMFENFNKLIAENEKLRAEKQKAEKEQKQTKPIPFWRENHKRTTSSGVMLRKE